MARAPVEVYPAQRINEGWPYQTQEKRRIEDLTAVSTLKIIVYIGSYDVRPTLSAPFHL